MERPHYRRVTGPNAPKEVKRDDRGGRSSFSERLVIQFIICGVIMALILVLNLFDTSMTHNIKGVIQDQTTADDVKQILNGASGTVKTIFGNIKNNKSLNSFDLASDASTGNAENSDSLAAPTPQPANRTAPPDAGQTRTARPAASPSPGNFRIDEDILTQIQADSDGK